MMSRRGGLELVPSVNMPVKDLSPDRAVRGRKRIIRLRQRPVVHSENGQRAVPLEKTLRDIERFFLTSPIEVQFAFVKPKNGTAARACLKYHAPTGKKDDRYFFGKGLTAAQTFASASFEFFERHSAAMLPGDFLLEAAFEDVADAAIDPVELVLDRGSPYRPSRKIDWVWGYSLTRKRPVLVPANHVFLPYAARRADREIVASDSNGIASGNTLEEAILHALLEVVERDQVIIGENNGFPLRRIAPSTLPPSCGPVIELAKQAGFETEILAGRSDLPIPFAAAFLYSKSDPRACSAAFGCYLDPTLAVERALTEAIQLLPPSARSGEWRRSGGPRRFRSHLRGHIPFDSLENFATSDIKRNIEKCVSILDAVGSEVVAVDLTHPAIRFPAVRVLATRLQPLLRKESMRLSPRFFEVPLKLGFRTRPLDPSRVKARPICGYR